MAICGFPFILWSADWKCESVPRSRLSTKADSTMRTIKFVSSLSPKVAFDLYRWEGDFRRGQNYEINQRMVTQLIKPSGFVRREIFFFNFQKQISLSLFYLVRCFDRSSICKLRKCSNLCNHNWKDDAVGLERKSRFAMQDSSESDYIRWKIFNFQSNRLSIVSMLQIDGTDLLVELVRLSEWTPLVKQKWVY